MSNHTTDRTFLIFSNRTPHFPSSYFVQRQIEDTWNQNAFPLARLVELCSSRRAFFGFEKIYKKRRSKRLFDGAANVLLAEREKSTYSPAERG